MTVDDIDFCSDVPEMKYKDGQIVSIGNLSKARTAWIRKAIDGVDDKFIKSLNEDEKSELSLEIQEFQRLGE